MHEGNNKHAAQRNIALSYLLPREYGASCINGRWAPNLCPRSYSYHFNAVKDVAAPRIPRTLNPNNGLQFPKLDAYDKVFASCWLDAESVLMATKSNELVVWHTSTNEYLNIRLPPSPSDVPSDSCGIHDIDINNARNLLATGGQSPLDIAILSLPSFAPVAVLQGHSDWVFAAKFLEDDILASASRDCSVNLWRVPQQQTDNVATSAADATATTVAVTDNVAPVIAPLLNRKEHTMKVRALEYNREKKHIVTMSADETVKIWDRSNMDVISTVRLGERSELVCLAVDEANDLIAVGSQQDVLLIDARSSNVVMWIPSMNENWGTRSLNFYHYLVSVGGGMGRLSFFDVRAKGYLQTYNDKPYLQADGGWIYNEFFENTYHALYTHCFDPTGTRVFVAGGPIMLGVRGVYAALW